MDNNIVNSVAVALAVAAATASGSALAKAKAEPAPLPESAELQVFDLEEEVSGADSVEAATSDTEVASFFVFTRRSVGG